MKQFVLFFCSLFCFSAFGWNDGLIAGLNKALDEARKNIIQRSDHERAYSRIETILNGEILRVLPEATREELYEILHPLAGCLPDREPELALNHLLRWISKSEIESELFDSLKTLEKQIETRLKDVYSEEFKALIERNNDTVAHQALLRRFEEKKDEVIREVVQERFEPAYAERFQSGEGRGAICRFKQQPKLTTRAIQNACDARRSPFSLGVSTPSLRTTPPRVLQSLPEEEEEEEVLETLTPRSLPEPVLSRSKSGACPSVRHSKPRRKSGLVEIHTIVEEDYSSRL